MKDFPMQPPGTLYWVTGLSRVGKTTIGRVLYQRILSVKKNVVFLDGDSLRVVFGEQEDYTREGRMQLAAKYGRLCKMLTDQGIDVVCATICLFHSCQAWNREHISRYCEVFLTSPMSVLRERDNKGLYREAEQGVNVVGVDIEAEFPVSPDLTIENDGSRAPELLAEKIFYFTEGGS